MPAHEVEARELEDGRLVEARLEVPVECLQRLALAEAAVVAAPRDPLLEPARCLDAEDVLEQRGRARSRARRPREKLVELGERLIQPEDLEVSSQSFEDEGVVVVSLLALAGSLGHVPVS